MATQRISASRRILAGGFIMAAAAAPVIAGQSAPEPGVAVAQCTSGEEHDVFTMTCTPYLVPISPPLFTTNAANPDIPEIDGIPCTGHNSGQCIGLAEEAEAAGPPAVPRSTISSSP